jgi:glycosyltransferase involved in cell wall biosynthesis
VAIVYPLPFGDDGAVGGGERYALEFAKAMAAVTDTVLVTIASDRERERVGKLRIESYPWLTLVRGLRQNPLSFGFLRSLVDVDVIHCLSYNTLLTETSVLFARLTGKRIFITDVGGGGDLSLARWLNVAAMSDGLLLLSEFASRAFRHNSCPRDVIYGGVDIDRFTPVKGLRSRKVLFVGRLLGHKGINYLIDAAEPGLPLVIAGRAYDPAYFSYLTSRAAGKDVTFMTGANDDDVIAQYRSSAVLVLPSVYEDVFGNKTALPELLGLTILEAMACGTPVICTAVGSLPELVEDGVTGFVVPPNDSTALAGRIALLVNDLDRAAEMGTRARAAVEERFTWRQVVDRCLQRYGGLAA